uniref:phenylalanine--tRNA ligase n=1 Tax=Ochromonas sp. CCMP1393 TaxID=420556 RepID=A0A0D3ML36_9STRA|nr:phenylalanyl tRNA synthetase beta subunit [Ochromonas sp. CCMP1393]
MKIPSNREDLLNETFFIQDLASILLFQSYKIWEKAKLNYYSILKQKYFAHYNYQSVKIDSAIPDVLVYNIKLKITEHLDSPVWIQKKLKSIGIPVQNNLNDVVDLVKFEWGQSFQLLDLSNAQDLNLKKLSERKLFKNFNGKKYELNKGTIVLENEKKEIITFLGLMNIDLTQTENKEIYLNGIYYDIHENALKLNPLESSVPLRHLRNEFLENFKFAFQRLLTLFEIIYSIECFPKIYVSSKRSTIIKPKRVLKLKKKSIKNFLNISKVDSKIFKKAGLKIICYTPTELYFEIPNFRNDLKREVDLIEEYSRFIGYKNFSEILPVNEFTYSKTKNESINYLKTFLLNYGFTEILTNPIKSTETQTNSSIFISNPLTSELSNLRTELLSELTKHFEANLRLNAQSINLFEIGRIFQKTENGIIEIDKLGGVFQLERMKKEKKVKTEWFIAKGFIENLLQNFGYDENNLTFEEITNESIMLHKTKSVVIKFKNKTIGIFGELTPKFEKFKGLKYPIYLFEFDLRYFEKWRMNSIIPLYNESSKYTVIIKDLSFSIKKSINFSLLKSEIKKQSSFIKEINFFDIYFDENNISSIKLGIRISFQSNSHTLRNEEIENEMKKISTFLIENFSIKFKS